jgi:hypothetical protein
MVTVQSKDRRLQGNFNDAEFGASHPHEQQVFSTSVGACLCRAFRDNEQATRSEGHQVDAETFAKLTRYRNLLVVVCESFLYPLSTAPE